MPPENRRPLLEITAGELAEWMVRQGRPRYHARQVFDWIFRLRAEDFETMSSLPKALRAELAREWTAFGSTSERTSVCEDGTIKLLIRCADERRIECVLMAEERRRTVCVSTQVGCGMGCVFCASGLKGVERNLSAGEIVEQVLLARNLLPKGEDLTHIVVMGMGESLANLENVVTALDRICGEEGLGLSQRRVTISTVGLPEKMLKLAALDRRYHLAVSLHAPNPLLRDRLVPINGRVGLVPVLKAADAYFEKTGRQVTYEYVMLKDVNDAAEHAEELARLLARRKSHVNLIPYNPVAGLPYGRPASGSVRRFLEILRARGISASARKTKGDSIDAACGQLRRRVETESAAVAPEFSPEVSVWETAASLSERDRGETEIGGSRIGRERESAP